MKVDKDWGYLYFIIPSIISFLFSVIVIFITFSYSNLRKKRFHQLSLLISIFSLFQSLSWFRARYERHTTLCHIQEYIFQISTLLQSFTAVIICTTIYHTIKDGRALKWYNYRMLIWFLIPILSFILSSSLGTAFLFCPFNYQHNLYYPNLSQTNSRHFQHFIGYICFYLFPMCFSWLLSAYYSYITSKYASEHFTNKITVIAYQLRLYPIFLALCMFPISTFFFLVIIIDQEIHPLLFIGAILVSSTGTINGIVYLTVVRNNTIKRNRLTHYYHHPSHPLHDDSMNIRNVQSINYHLIISKLIKSSGQSYLVDEGNNSRLTADVLRDDDEGEEEEEGNVGNRRNRSNNSGNHNRGSGISNNNNGNRSINGLFDAFDNDDYWSDEEDDDGYEDVDIGTGTGIDTDDNKQNSNEEGSSTKHSSKEKFHSSFGSSKSGGMLGNLFEAFYLPREEK